MARRGHDRELYDGDGPPTSGPVPLAGLIKFKSNRNKGNKAWRPLAPSDLDDDGHGLEDQTLADQGLAEPFSTDNRNYNERPQPHPESSAEKASVFNLPSLQTDFSESPLLRRQGPSSGFSAAEPIPTTTMFQRKDSEDISPTDTRNSTNDEIIQVFGHRLPDPIHLQQVTGNTDGEVTFIAHPNRDVSAHQWSAPSFQWVNIGQFSHFRRKVEGQLASDRLRGQTVGMRVPQNTLKYFKAIAEQRQVLAIEQSRQPQPSQRLNESSLSQVRANSQNNFSPRRPTLAESDHFESLSSASGPLYGDRLPTLGNLAFARGAKIAQQSSAAVTPLIRTVSNVPPEDPFVTTTRFPQQLNLPPVLTAAATPTIREAPGPSRLPGMDFNFEFPLRSTIQRETDSPQQSTDDDARREFYVRCEKERIRQDLWPQERQANLRDISVGEDAASSLKSPSDRQELLSRFLPLNSPDLERLKERLVELGTQAEQRGGIEAGNNLVAIPDVRASAITSRTPAFPPGFENTALPPTLTRQPSTLNANAPLYNRPNFTNNPTRPLISTDSPHPSHMTAPTANLRVSDPDTIHASHIPEISTGLGHQRPTPQTFKGPFFADTMPTAYAPTTPLALHLTEVEKLQMWWTDGQRPARQQEYYKSIMSTATANARAYARGSGLSRAPGSAIALRGGDVPAQNPVNRLLVPVYENLREYADEARDPSHQRDYFTRVYTAPPQYAIDQSANGNNSFFGEDFGTPPARFGRDPRFSGFERFESMYNSGGRGTTGMGRRDFSGMGSGGMGGGLMRGVGVDVGFGGGMQGPWNHS
ncbi:hypothetical protein K432DRAFT_363915 [Lepidopterella palustris CBS 459.81]|uniref:Uncharacterized protein n=1 Tax=Lepidopterella palustris CBS 459.81 TaxID=1314670 RepID=A0A8E2DYN9_9PEZI|nr:hypothetical protein K432DRAFT_363915 [Lepidopterella palustris CBS 459.81]